MSNFFCWRSFFEVTSLYFGLDNYFFYSASIFRLDLLCCWAICILLVIWFHIDKVSEKKINIYAFRKITFFFTFKVGICLTAYVSARALTTELHIRDKGKIPQQLYSLLEHATLYYIVCLEVSNSYGVIPNRLKIKKFCVYWKCKYELSYFLKPEINKTWKISQHVRKLYAKFFLLFKYHKVQEDWLFRTKSHLGKFEKADSQWKLKKLHKLLNNKTLDFDCLKRFESQFEFFSFKFIFLEFCVNFVCAFENLYYLLCCI